MFDGKGVLWYCSGTDRAESVETCPGAMFQFHVVETSSRKAVPASLPLPQKAVAVQAGRKHVIVSSSSRKVHLCTTWALPTDGADWAPCSWQP